MQVAKCLDGFADGASVRSERGAAKCLHPRLLQARPVFSAGASLSKLTNL